MDIIGNRLKDKVVIVTGAGASGDDEFVGIGQAIAVLMAAQGASVLIADMDEANAVKTVSQIHEFEGKVKMIDHIEPQTHKILHLFLIEFFVVIVLMH